MTSPHVADGMILATGLMPYFAVVGAKASRAYDNADPHDLASLAIFLTALLS